MGTGGTHFTEAWVSVGSSVWFCLDQHFAFPGLMHPCKWVREAHGILGSHGSRYTGERMLPFSTVTPGDLGTEVFPSCMSGQAANRESLLSHMKKEGIPWFWGWRYQSAGHSEALKLECGGLGRLSPDLSLEHWPTAPSESVLPGVWSRMQPMAKIASKRVVKRKRAEFLRPTESNF